MRLSDLRQLGKAWKASQDGRTAITRMEQALQQRSIADRVPTPVPADHPLRALRPYGDRPICACGKVSYPTRAIAQQAVDEAGTLMRTYACPLGHPIYHLKARGRSTRQGGLRW